MNQSKPRLILSKDTGFYWCPCGNGPIGNVNLMYDTVRTAGEVGTLITRAYYKCFICNREFDLKKVEGTGHWDYEDGEVPKKDRVKLESPQDFSDAIRRKNEQMTVLVIPLNKEMKLTGSAMEDIQIFPTMIQAERYIDRKIRPKYGNNMAVLERETNFSYARR